MKTRSDEEKSAIQISEKKLTLHAGICLPAWFIIG